MSCHVPLGWNHVFLGASSGGRYLSYLHHHVGRMVSPQEAERKREARRPEEEVVVN